MQSMPPQPRSVRAQATMVNVNRARPQSGWRSNVGREIARLAAVKREPKLGRIEPKMG
jgi:hypothetical protein